MKKRIRARVTVQIELDITNENWNEHSSVEQVHREGGEAAVQKVIKLCDRWVRIIGTPRIEAIITESER